MNLTIDINDDIFDDMLLTRLKNDYQMLRDDLDIGVNESDFLWMTEVKNALETLITTYYSSPTDREEFLKEIANGS